jgi:hypothetical protein
MNIPQNNKKSKEELLKEFAKARSTVKNRQLDQPIKDTPEWLKKAIKADPRFSETKKKLGTIKRK